MSILKLDFDKTAFNNFMDSMVMTRFQTVSEINNFIYNNTGIKIFLEPHSENESKVAEGYDERHGSNLTVNDEDLCYIDVYYLKDNDGKMYITEAGLDFNT